MKHPVEGIELVPIHLKNYQLNSPLLYLGVLLPREAEKCDGQIVGTYPLVPLFKKGYHHPGLPLFPTAT